MNTKIVRILYAVLLLAILVTLICLVAVHIKAGLQTGLAKIYLAAYALLIVWAVYRLFTLVRDILRG